MDKVDVIIPTYRIKPELLQKCLSSVLNQTHLPNTITVVDATPLSDDNYQEIRLVSESEPSVNYVRQKGIGLSQARNQGIECGNSKYVATIDGDDWWYPQHLERILDTARTSSESTVVWWDKPIIYPITLFTHDGVVNHYAEIYLYDDLDTYDNLSDVLNHYIIYPSTALFRRKDWERLGGFDEGLDGFEDIDFFLQLAQGNTEGKYINEFGCITTASIRETKPEEHKDNSEEKWEIVMKKHPTFNFIHDKRKYVLRRD